MRTLTFSTIGTIPPDCSASTHPNATRTHTRTPADRRAQTVTHLNKTTIALWSTLFLRPLSHTHTHTHCLLRATKGKKCSMKVTGVCVCVCVCVCVICVREVTFLAGCVVLISSPAIISLPLKPPPPPDCLLVPNWKKPLYTHVNIYTHAHTHRYTE